MVPKRTGKRRAAKCGSMRTCQIPPPCISLFAAVPVSVNLLTDRHYFSNAIPHEDRTNGVAICKRFCGGHDVRVCVDGRT